MTPDPRAGALLGALAAFVSACSNPPATAIEQLSESRRIAAEMLFQVTKAAEASNRAVMSGADDAAKTFAAEAREAIGSAQRNSEQLRPILTSQSYTTEAGLLSEFDVRFGKYRELNEKILELAVQNTNLKAQRLSFGPLAVAASTIASSLDSLKARVPQHGWQVRATAAAALTSVREIQVLDAPHIAEADLAAMDALEKRMKAAETSVRGSLKLLEDLVDPEVRPRLDEATRAFDQFMKIHVELIQLSRTNSNVHSLALVLGQTRTFIAACEESLKALGEALAKRRIGTTR